MARKRVNYYAICPYYQHESISTIYCEGIDNTNLIHLAFLNPKVCLKYKAEKCREKYESCEIYKMLAERRLKDGVE